MARKTLSKPTFTTTGQAITGELLVHILLVTALKPKSLNLPQYVTVATITSSAKHQLAAPATAMIYFNTTNYKS